MANFYVGIGFNSKSEKGDNHTMIKVANNKTREIKISTDKLEAKNKEELIILLMSKMEENLRKIL